MDVATALRKAVKQKGLSVYQIAMDTGLNQSGLNRFFNGSKSELQLSTIQVLFDYLGLEARKKQEKLRGRNA